MIKVNVERDNRWIDLPIQELTDEELVIQFYAEAKSSTRWVSSQDGPMIDKELKEEILKRMRRGAA